MVRGILVDLAIYFTSNLILFIFGYVIKYFVISHYEFISFNSYDFKHNKFKK